MRSSVRRSRILRSVPLLLVSVCALLTLIYAFTHARLLGTSGLTATSAPGFHVEWRGALLPPSWAPDEIGPIDVRGGVQSAFAGGWASIYPPFHHAVIALLYLPFEAALAAGIGDLEDVVWSGALLLVGRALSVLMALGIVWLAHRIALEQFGDSAATFTAWITLALLPLTYYAKTVNLDVPYVFWLTLSLLFFARLFKERAQPSHFYLFTLSGVVAVCTKDQAYGFYVLPAIYLSVAGLLGPRAVARGWPAVPSRRVLGIVVCIAVAGFVLLHNLLFNSSGFAEHVRLIAGPGSAGYAMFPNTPGGHVTWLPDHVAPTQRVAGVGHDALLARSSKFPWRPVRLSPELLNDTRPEFLIVNVGFALRAEQGSAAQRTYVQLDAGATDYRRVARFRGRVMPPVSWEQRFQNVTDNPFTNLTRVNPTIDIYVRKDVIGVGQ